MKRHIMFILLLLLLGAIVNIAVAWGCATWSPHYRLRGEESIEPPARWPAYLEALEWPAPTRAFEPGEVGLGVTRNLIFGGHMGFLSVCLDIRQFGLPARALQWEYPVGRPGGDRKMTEAAHEAAGLRTGIDVFGRNSGGPIRPLPMTPLYPGFLINTLFYAAIIWLLFFAPFAAQRMLRRRRGLCERCAYQIGTSPVCTECGSPVAGKVASEAKA